MIMRPTHCRQQQSLPPLALLVDKADRIWCRPIAAPSLVQLVLRFALAVPFWQSGILKWAGFLKLNDTAVTLFTDEFMLHLPGGPYHYPAPAVMAFLSGCGEIMFPSCSSSASARASPGLGCCS